MLKLKAGAIRRLREQKCWSQEDLAEKAGISVRTLQRLEGGTSANGSTVALVAEALNVPPTDVFQETPSEGESTKPPVPNPTRSPIPVVLRRMTVGKDLLECAGGSMSMIPLLRGAPDSLDSETIGSIVDGLRDFADIAGDLSFSDQLRYGVELTEQVGELQARGWWILAGQKRHALRSPAVGKPMAWVTFIVMVARPDDSIIQHRENGDAVALVELPARFTFA